MVERNTPTDTKPTSPAGDRRDYTVTVCAFNIPAATATAEIVEEEPDKSGLESIRHVTVQVFDADMQPDTLVNERQLRREVLVVACKLAEDLRDEGDPTGSVACKDPVIDPVSWGTPAARALACYERHAAAGVSITPEDLCKLSGSPAPSIGLARAVLALAELR